MKPGRAGKFGGKNMVHAFFEKTDDWEMKAGDKQQALIRRGEAERAAVVAWVEAGAPLEHYNADAIPLPDPATEKDIPEELRTQASPLPKRAPARQGRRRRTSGRWRRGSNSAVEALTQSDPRPPAVVLAPVGGRPD